MTARPGIQPAGATNNGNLLIPNKQQMASYDAIKYGTDMRAIERWCNSLIIEIELGSILWQSQYYVDDGSNTIIFIPGSGLSTPAGGAPLDTTNLTYGPMTVPDSGKIRAEISFPWQYLVPTAGDSPHAFYMSLSDHTDPTIVHAPISQVDVYNSNLTEAQSEFYGGKGIYDAILTDLTAGDSLQFDLWGETAGSPGNPNGYRLLTATGSGFNTWTGPILATFYEA